MAKIVHVSELCEVAMDPNISRQAHKARRWPIWLVFGVLASVAAFLLGMATYAHISTSSGQQIPAMQPVPVTHKAPVALRHASMHRMASIQVSPSPAVQIYIPSAASRHLVINDPVLQMPTSCMRKIEPPLAGPDIADVFQCMDYGSLPGTNSPSLTVLAGHASRYIATVFDKLDAQGTLLVGRSVLLRTRSSGKHWLAYKVQHVYRPLKSQLPYMASVWGNSGKSTAGRLVLVTCIEHADGTPSTNNFVVVAQLTGLK